MDLSSGEIIPEPKLDKDIVSWRFGELSKNFKSWNLDITNTLENAANSIKSGEYEQKDLHTLAGLANDLNRMYMGNCPEVFASGTGDAKITIPEEYAAKGVLPAHLLSRFF